MAPVKDVELLSQVVRVASAQSSKAFFLVVGDGEEKTRLESLVQGCNNVKLLGWWRNMDQIWCAADAAILTSRNEGTPTALIEAMAAHLPFVATKVGGVQDLAVSPLLELPNDMGQKAANGFVVVRTPEALFHCVKELIDDRLGSRKMGEVGHSFVSDQFSADRLIAKIVRLYNNLTGSECVRESVDDETDRTGPSRIEEAILLVPHESATTEVTKSN
jgi:glycosyltransferase involved in cell wall biosynthesis